MSSDLSEVQDKPAKKKRYAIGGISIGVLVSIFIVGNLSWMGFSGVMEWTNTESFCTSCHEMQVNLREYEKSVHDVNRVGVTATCPDCHVPKPLGPKLFAKLVAVKDIYHHLVGTIDSKEKYNEHRLSMAQAVWKKMKDTDSRECRNCHNVPSMLFDEQQGRAARKHKNMAELNKTCIDCHKGVAHDLPEDYDEEEN